MRKCFLLLATVMLFSVSSSVVAGEFKVYPGAKLDERASNDANEMAKQSKMTSKSKVYTTDDAFDQVVSFYKGIGKEYNMPGGPSKGPQCAFILFDEAKDLSTSKLWAKIQRPALGLYKEDLQEMKSRDITVIVLVEK
ncbi:exported hypothetical protein [uncultured Desulfobacterium sp.]|uniref:Lipoprotein n=1 Tax=uncultured Desulfobacterium sp. TaxID=201089 RepID=A0A445N3B7_9BACT|nr:exported hypothetical protein [uncultured Desulfobacterium sp.]